MNYVLNNHFVKNRGGVTVVGCGGTGSFVAEGLCRMQATDVKLMLVDFDRVEERNLGRQNFVREDLGKFKSEALAYRLSLKYGRAIGYSAVPISLTPVTFSGLFIGCVDNGKARKDIELKFKSVAGSYQNSNYWWIDAGNGENFGQVLIGNSTSAPKYYQKENGGVFLTLPLPTLQRPDLLAQTPLVRVDCATIAEQGPTINQTMASITVEVIRRLIAGTCPWVQLYVDMEAGTMTPVYATPETVKVMTRKKLEKEVSNGR
jgi:hypothetical protein